MFVCQQAESDRESGASSPEGGGRQLAEARSPSPPRARTPHHQPHLNGSSEFVRQLLNLNYTLAKFVHFI